MLDKVKVVDEEKSTIKDDGELYILPGRQNRLTISFEINNITDKSFKNVWYEVSMNEEVKPFIGSGILTFTSDPMDVMSKEEAQKSTSELAICGFETEDGKLLTQEDVLEEYYDLRQDQLFDYLKEIKIDIHWDGGSQSETFPINGEIDRKDVSDEHDVGYN